MRLLATVLTGALCAAVTAYAQPKIEIVGGTTHNWGKVKPSESPLKAKIELRNTGTDTLVLGDPKPSCGCTAAPLEKKNLAPGESTYVNVTLNLSPTASGVTEKGLTITSNDPKQSSISMKLKADVFRTVSVEPPYLTFNNPSVGKQSTAKARIKNSSDKDLTITSVDSPGEITLNVKLPMVVKAGAAVDVEAKVTPTKTGYMNYEVKMNTDNADYPVLVLQAYGKVDEAAKSAVFEVGK